MSVLDDPIERLQAQTTPFSDEQVKFLIKALAGYRAVAEDAHSQWRHDYLWEKWGLSTIIDEANAYLDKALRT